MLPDLEEQPLVALKVMHMASIRPSKFTTINENRVKGQHKQHRKSHLPSFRIQSNDDIKDKATSENAVMSASNGFSSKAPL